MTPQERDVIAGIFDRLKPAASQPRDPEAEKLIADRLKDQPYAPYAMAQAVYVQEQALTNMQTQVEQLQAQIKDLQQQAATAQPAQGGFLSGLFGGGAKPAPAPERPMQQAAPMASGMRPGGPWGGQAAQPQAGPWGGQPQAAAPAAGGGFMASALTTAAGVAGGMVVGNMLMNAFKGDHGAGAAKGDQSASAAGEPASQTAALSDNASNTSDASAHGNDGYTETYQDAGYDDADMGGDDGDSWA